MTTIIVDRRDEVARVLADDLLTVRPPGEPVPRHLAGTPLGDVFARFARMNDGARHAWLRALVDDELQAFTDEAVRSAAHRVALFVQRTAAHDAARLVYLMRFTYPAAVIASLLGFADMDILALAVHTRRIVLAVATASDPGSVRAGNAALAEIEAVFAGHERWRRQSGDARANAIGLMFQSVDGCAGLIGNTLVRHARGASERDVPDCVANVAAGDPAIHTTRRYTPDGETRLVRLTSGLPFGYGVHACPGREIALTIAANAVATLRAADIDLSAFVVPEYQPSVNARIPVCPMDAGYA